MEKAQEDFLQEYRELCEKHGLCVVPTYNFKPSAHDHMTVVKLDPFWKDFIDNQIFNVENGE